MSQGNENSRVAIVGAGPAGLTVAYLLTKQGYRVDVFEASDRVGGLSKTIELWGQKVDLGPHRFFTKDDRILKLWLEVVGEDYSMVKRLTRVYYAGKFFQYPLKPIETFTKLGFWDGSAAIFSYLKEKLIPTKEDESFEKWVVRRFGKKLYQLFFKTYSEKLWGIPGTHLDKDFAAQRIKKLTFFEAVREGLREKKNHRHGTLIDEFAYPKEGTGMVYQRMGDFVNRNGGRIHLNARVTSVNKTNTGEFLIGTNNGETPKYKHLVSTMPLTQLILQLPDAPGEVLKAAKELRFRNTILVYLLVDQRDVFPDNWIYIHDPSLKVGRITNFSNWWSPEITGQSDKTILCMEYWANDGEELWLNSNERLVALAKKEIAKTSLVMEAHISAGHVYRLPKCYPVYKIGYKNHLGSIISYLSKISGLIVIGRYGSFKYNNQDHSILMGILGAENIAGTGNHDLWKINTDYEVYQERGKNATVLYS